jgi:hypothetical protein
VLKPVHGVNGRPKPRQGQGTWHLWWGTFKNYKCAMYVAKLKPQRQEKLKRGEAVPLTVYEGSTAKFGFSRDRYFDKYRRTTKPPYYWAFQDRVFSTNAHRRSNSLCGSATPAAASSAVHSRSWSTTTRSSSRSMKVSAAIGRPPLVDRSQCAPQARLVGEAVDDREPVGASAAVAIAVGQIDAVAHGEDVGGSPAFTVALGHQSTVQPSSSRPSTSM